MKEFLSTEDVARCLGISRQNVVKQMKAGLLPYVHRGRCLRIPRVAWETWLTVQAQAALAATKQSHTKQDNAEPHERREQMHDYPA